MILPGPRKAVKNAQKVHFFVIYLDKYDVFINAYCGKKGKSMTKLRSSEQELQESDGVNRFLNRLLMLPLKWQDEIFVVFSAIYDDLVRIDKEQEKYELNKMVLLNNTERGFSESVECLYRDPLFCGARCMLTKVRLDRGILWEQALSRWCDDMIGRRLWFKREHEEVRERLVRDLQANRITNMETLTRKEKKLELLTRKLNALNFEGYYYFKPANANRRANYKEVCLVRYDGPRQAFEILTPHRGIVKKWGKTWQISPRNVLNENGGFYRINMISERVEKVIRETAEARKNEEAAALEEQRAMEHPTNNNSSVALQKYKFKI